MAAWRDLDSSKQMGEAGRLLVVGWCAICWGRRFLLAPGGSKSYEILESVEDEVDLLYFLCYII